MKVRESLHKVVDSAGFYSKHVIMNDFVFPSYSTACGKTLIQQIKQQIFLYWVSVVHQLIALKSFIPRYQS